MLGSFELISDEGKRLQKWEWMVSIDSILIAVLAVAFFLLFRLLLFHIYIKSKGMTTYQYILRQRDINKVGQIQTPVKETGLLKRMRTDRFDEESPNNINIDESRQAININATIDSDIQKEHTRELTSLRKENQGQDSPNNEASKNENFKVEAKSKRHGEEEGTDLKHKGDASKLEKNTAVDLAKKQPAEKSTTLAPNQKQINALKEDEGSFVLTKPANPGSSNELASELDKLKPKLDLPLGFSSAKDDKEPGEWTLRQRNNEE